MTVCFFLIDPVPCGERKVRNQGTGLNLSLAIADTLVSLTGLWLGEASRPTGKCLAVCQIRGRHRLAQDLFTTLSPQRRAPARDPSSPAHGVGYPHPTDSIICSLNPLINCGIYVFCTGTSDGQCRWVA